MTSQPTSSFASTPGPPPPPVHEPSTPAGWVSAPERRGGIGRAIGYAVAVFPLALAGLLQLVAPGFDSDFPPLRAEAKDTRLGARTRVVLADDSVLLREGIARLLEDAGFEVVGQSGTAVLYKSDHTRWLAVPKEAVLLEAGRPYVFVQVGGERFARRYVEIATRDRNLVGLKSGLKPGDRVVIRGAYDVQLASAAKGLPAEGHVH